MTKKIVCDQNGKSLDYDVAVHYMDDDIREDLHGKIAPCTDQYFYVQYCKAHFAKYGTDFVIN
jgi:hypothetical protein